MIIDLFYTFFGSSRQLRVYHPFYVTSYESLLADIQRQRITHVVARNLPGLPWGRYHDVDRRLSEHLPIFREIERGSWLCSYEADLNAIGRALGRSQDPGNSTPSTFDAPVAFPTSKVPRWISYVFDSSRDESGRRRL